MKRTRADSILNRSAKHMLAAIPIVGGYVRRYSELQNEVVQARSRFEKEADDAKRLREQVEMQAQREFELRDQLVELNRYVQEQRTYNLHMQAMLEAANEQRLDAEKRLGAERKQLLNRTHPLVRTDFQKTYADAVVELEAARRSGMMNPVLSKAAQEVALGIATPDMTRCFAQRRPPPPTVAFLTVANDLFVPGLRTLVSSLLDIYPNLESDIIVFHDGTLTSFIQDHLTEMYPRIKFEVPDMSWLREIPLGSANQKRIGILGYMGLMALTKSQYQRVLILDSDIVVIDDISMLWTGVDSVFGQASPDCPVDQEQIFAVADVGARPWTAISPVLERSVVNSGVLSLPKALLTANNLLEIKQLAVENCNPFCPILDSFADQKVWNRFLATRKTKLLPINFNCNARYLDRFLGGDQSFLRVIHFTGTKPWFDQFFLDEKMVPEKSPQPVLPDLWKGVHMRTYGKLRQYRYYRDVAFEGHLRPSRTLDESGSEATCLIIEDSSSLRCVDLLQFAHMERFVFDQFVFRNDFDVLCPENLVLGRAGLFGGWLTHNPQIPSEYLELLYSKRWRPRIWTSYYFRPYLRRIGLDQDFDIQYALFERPHVAFPDGCGCAGLDGSGFAQDHPAGSLNLALPIALRMGFRRIGLLNCDMACGSSIMVSDDWLCCGHSRDAIGRLGGNSTERRFDVDAERIAYRICEDALGRIGCTLVDYTWWADRGHHCTPEPFLRNDRVLEV